MSIVVLEIFCECNAVSSSFVKPDGRANSDCKHCHVSSWLFVMLILTYACIVVVLF